MKMSKSTKSAKSRSKPKAPSLPGQKEASDSEGEFWSMEAIVGNKYDNKRKKWLFLVKWLGAPPANNSWEDANSFSRCPETRREFLQYIYAHLIKRDADKIRLGSAGARTRQSTKVDTEKGKDVDPREEFKKDSAKQGIDDVSSEGIIDTRKKVSRSNLAVELAQEADEEEDEDEQLTPEE